jgi:site-specific recombinase XerD
MANAEKLLTQYLDYLEIEKNRSIKTRENYERYLRAFFAAERIKDLSDINEERLRRFRLTLARLSGRQGRGLEKSTQSYYVIAIRNFLKYAARKGYKVLSPDVIELPKLSQREIEVMEYKDLERILREPKGDSLRALRDRAILEMLFSTGLRLAELCRLDRYEDFSRGEISVRGKGGKIRVVFVSDGARQAIQAYEKKRADADEALFVSLTKKGAIIGRISPRAVERLVRHYARAAGISGRVTPHSFRHLFATDLLMNGADLRSVQELLGHSNIGTTQIYTHLTNKELKEIHKSFHGRRRG